MRPFLLALLLPVAALAHQASVSYGDLSVQGREVAGVLRFALADVRAVAPGDARKLPVAVLQRLLVEPLAIQEAGRPCALQPGVTVAPDGEDGLALTARWTCPEEIEELSVRPGFLESFPPGHAHLARVAFGPDEVSQRVAQLDDPSFEVRRSRGAAGEFWRFLRLGVAHIFTGYDHIAFLLGLLLLGGSLRELVKIVTAFTLAHSLTLALATLNLLAPSPRLIEPLIAASIVFVGAENLWALGREKAAQALRHRWMVTFAFGLVHGFGFASVLRELRLPRSVLATGLVSFNLGVEVGQVCIVLLALPLLSRAVRLRSFASLASACVSVLGLLLLTQRLMA